jgi:hypothetical protein
MLQDEDVLEKKRKLVLALKRSHTLSLRECFDPFKPDSRPNEKQLEILKGMNDILYSWVLGGNQSGKSMLGGRVASWFYLRCHPYIDVNKLWPDEPILILVVGRNHNQVEELWSKKIRPFLRDDEYRENRQGGTLQYVENPKNGSKIVFASHGGAETREKLQSYSAMLVWLDEMTDSLGVIEELQRRTMAKRARMLLTATPKIRAEAVKKFIETPTPYSRVYKISMLDNPIYEGRREEILSQIMGLPESQRNTILYGDWYAGEQSVFSFDPNVHVENPANYSVLWPHVISVDPAASGLMGFTLWAAPDVHAFTWYCVKSEYLKGAAPSDLVAQVEDRVKGHQIIYRLMDSHESWFQKEAQKLKIHYRGVENKRDRKTSLIAQLNQALASGRVRIAEPAQTLQEELSTAQWSEKVEDKIVNSSSYHVADCAQYFVDSMPKFKELQHVELSHDTMLHLANKRRLAAEATQKTKPRDKWRIVAKKGKVWKQSPSGY